MRRPISSLAVAFAATVTFAMPASAQPSGTHGVVLSIGAGAQVASDSMSDRFEFERNVETASADVKYPSKPGVLVDGGLGFRFWKNLGAGVAVSYVSRNGAADVDARIPHPFVFQRPRTVSGKQGSVSGTETAVHAQLQYTMAATPRVEIVLSAGPSWFNVSQELVNEVQYSETYPYDEATFLGASTKRASASAAGANAGIDIRWMFSRSVGIGGLVRFTRAKISLDVDDRHVSMNAGGIQTGVGIRVGF